MKRLSRTCATVALGLWAAAVASAQQPYGGARPAAGDQPGLTVQLIDADKKAAAKTATVDVKVSGIKLIDAGLAQEMPMAGQGHLHYQVDNGPVIATATTTLGFHGLAPGAHTITVSLAANDHSPLGPKQTVTVRVPASAGGRK